jgi:hypothetical protein
MVFLIGKYRYRYYVHRCTASAAYYDYILGLNPKRIVFNPGTENPEFETLAQSKGIDVEEACTLVLLSTGQY